MRWTSSKPAPRTGDRRTVVRFAWLPVRCKGNIVVWLERYNAIEEYIGGTFIEFWMDVPGERTTSASETNQ